MIRIATIGTSMITSSLLEVLNPNPRAVFVGTCSRDAQRAEAFTQAHGAIAGSLPLKISRHHLTSTPYT